MKCYKIVRADLEGNLKSAFLTSGKAVKIYKPLEKIIAHPLALEAGYGLLTFRNLEDAKRMILSFSNHQMWKADGEKKMKLPVKRSVNNLRKCIRIATFIDVLKTDYTPYIKDWPIGTVMYESVTLLERVK